LIFLIRYWLYGEKILDEKDAEQKGDKQRRIKGWLPRRCAVEVMNSSLSRNSDSETEDINESKVVDSQSSNGGKKSN